MYLKRYYKQTATYWAPGTPDKFGKPNFAAPAQTKCRWENVVQTVYDAKGQEITSQATVAVPSDFPVVLDGYLFLGVSVAVDPRTLSGAQQIRVTHHTPDIRNLVMQQVALL